MTHYVGLVCIVYSMAWLLFWIINLNKWMILHLWLKRNFHWITLSLIHTTLIWNTYENMWLWKQLQLRRLCYWQASYHNSLMNWLINRMNGYWYWVREDFQSDEECLCSEASAWHGDPAWHPFLLNRHFLRSLKRN